MFMLISQILLLICLWVAIAAIIVLTAPLWLILLIMRLIEEGLYRLWYQAIRFSPEEIMWLHSSPQNLMVINGMAMFKTKVDIETLRKRMNESLLNVKNKKGEKQYPRVTKFVHFGFLNNYWIDEKKFDITEHVYEWSTNHVGSEKDLQNLINKLAIRPLINKEHKSPWELVLIHYKSDNNNVKSTMFIRFNHALGDGSSIIYFLTHGLNEAKITEPNIRTLSTKQKFLIKLKGFIEMPLVIFKVLFMKSPATNALNPNNLTGRKRYAWSKPIRLSLVKSIKSEMNVTVNDVLTGCLATEIHKSIQEHDIDIPSNYRVFLPADTRLSIEEVVEFGNKFGILFFDIPVSSSDPVKNTKEVHKRMNAMKNNAEAFTVRYQQRLSSRFLPEYIYRVMNATAISKGEMVVSNVPGPQETVIIANQEVEFLTFWPPQANGVGCTTSFFSYNGNVVVGMGCDEATKAHPSELIDSYEQTVKLLAKMVGENGVFESD